MLFVIGTLFSNVAADCDCSYTVQSGDTIFGTIAPATGIDWMEICECNGGTSECGALTVGEDIALPCPASSEGTPNPTPNPTPSPTQHPSSSGSGSSSNSADTDLPVLDGEIKRELYTDLTTNKDGTYYGEWDPELGGTSAITREKTVATGHCSYSGIHDLPAFGEDVVPVAVGLDTTYDGSLACGMCIEFQGTGEGAGNDPISTTTWQKGIIVDSCSACAPGDIDLAQDGDGRWNVNWRAVDCDTGSSKFEYVLTGSHTWWVKLQVRNNKVPIHKIEMMDSHEAPEAWHNYSDEWVEMIRTPDNHFLADTAVMQRPFNLNMMFRITSIFGEVVIEEIDTTDQSIPAMDFNSPTTGSVQFDEGSGSRRRAELKNPIQQRLAGLLGL